MCFCYSAPLPAPPSDDRGPEQYTNTVGYQHLSDADDDDDIYSKPMVKPFVFRIKFFYEILQILLSFMSFIYVVYLLGGL